ncbi:MAG: S-layer homology domain-containing protein, partial [Ruminococcaceae bacterium]|nr:S-layer homology domain-containing protein [Oscillospiraceae bacterium]
TWTFDTSTDEMDKSGLNSTVTDVDCQTHNYVYGIIEKPTCTKEGKKIWICTLCDDFYIETISVTEHNGEWEIIFWPTYTEEGLMILRCTECGALMGAETIDRLDKNDFFVDVGSAGDWYHDAVYYCAAKNYIKGNDKGLFMPTAKLTREQLVVILGRVAGADLSQYTETKFTDVKINSWYGSSVAWANKNGYVNGISKCKFGVGKNIDRESLATILYRYAQKQGIDVSSKADLTVYSDYAKISSWSKDACAWAVNTGLLTSTNTKVLTLSPKMIVNRAQAAQLFMNYDKKVLG